MFFRVRKSDWWKWTTLPLFDLSCTPAGDLVKPVRGLGGRGGRACGGRGWRRRRARSYARGRLSCGGRPGCPPS
eukprot:273029-Hanusia_phi.AAC.3